MLVLGMELASHAAFHLLPPWCAWAESWSEAEKQDLNPQDLPACMHIDVSDAHPGLMFISYYFLHLNIELESKCGADLYVMEW